MERIRVIVADDNPRVREGLIDLIGNEPSLDLVGVAEDASEAIDLAERHHPEVALVDVSMPGGGGARVARELRARFSPTRVIALSAHEGREIILRMLGAGVAGYLVKDAAPEEILHAIRECVAGHPVFSKAVTAALLEEIGGYLRRQEDESETLLQRGVRARRLIRGDGLSMALQPIMDLESGEIEGVEALARFTPPPDWGPTEWFDEVDELGLREELELAALRRGLAEADRLPAGWFLSVNLSPDAVTSDRVLRTLERHRVDRIVVEITEHARVADYASLVRALEDFRSRGGRVAIDDTGAGFASFRHVVVLVPDVIKLDMSLTRSIDQDRGRRALASAMISFASEVGATIVAEGIETAGELEALRALGVRFGQGFYLAPPRMVPGGLDPAEAFDQAPLIAS
jgi:EAL domain-containing protein (putative c-di-GMP-specific phosphodiesterase class I)/ActR/RegA family two-component response regulator